MQRNNALVAGSSAKSLCLPERKGRVHQSNQKNKHESHCSGLSQCAQIAQYQNCVPRVPHHYLLPHVFLVVRRGESGLHPAQKLTNCALKYSHLPQ